MGREFGFTPQQVDAMEMDIVLGLMNCLKEYYAQMGEGGAVLSALGV
jgi:hypothetical protein